MSSHLEEVDPILSRGPEDGLPGHRVAVLVKKAAVAGGRGERGRSARRKGDHEEHN